MSSQHIINQLAAHKTIDKVNANHPQAERDSCASHKANPYRISGGFCLAVFCWCCQGCWHIKDICIHKYTIQNHIWMLINIYSMLIFSSTLCQHFLSHSYSYLPLFTVSHNALQEYFNFALFSTNFHCHLYFPFHYNVFFLLIVVFGFVNWLQFFCMENRFE